ncbi:AAA+-type ATPase, SpoVK/Ycf46/Vps4 family [Thalassobacillus cyri]|uniref:AAA+-type ATPase, SpoVK/Ycf46/Vps4 family n=1 Tax=Thalassobacillus cyri TaxID=571932 RepID=A0A1H4GWQ7_9BACI|nr:AAA family ATPase [Thalassobacillus cyri]SEB14089.1 AAA+-type ATPase, SpoVK/Ycf46/Vps4 family [Thalassobacillus cyri]
MDVNMVKSELQQWNTIDKQPPISETTALKLMNDVAENEQDFKALLYVTLAYHRIRRHPEEDQLADFFIAQTKALKHNHPLLTQLNEAKKVMKVHHRLRETRFEDWVLHETDHQTAKVKKANTIHEQVNRLLEAWDPELVEKDIVDAASGRLKLYQESYHQLTELKTILEEAMETIENRRIRLPVSAINEKTKVLSDYNDELFKRLPAFLTGSERQYALEALDNMIGLKDVKSYIHRYYHYLKYQQQRKNLGFSMVDEPGLHMIMTGNPGTGKTTLARLLANIYYELGILETKEVVEVNRSHLVGAYIGQSEENTMNYVKQATGGVLFIDEAYSLSREGQTGNDYGQAVIDTLVSAMTSKEYGGKFAVILAGYPEEMRQFLWSNPGLRSRFPEQNHIELPDYQMSELLEIAEISAIENDYFFTVGGLKQLETLIDKHRVDDSFGNARTVKNLVLKIIFNKSANLSGEDHHEWIDHMRLTKEDVHLENEKETDNESPIHQLEELIGLGNVKDEVKKLSAFVKIQQERKDKDLPHVPVQLHSVFTGNPGTGKTTVAAIYANVLKQCGLLKRGHMIVVSRSDLVAGYVGQTAMKTKKKIREALGGVLFIDEAYSLYNGGRDDFGKEAIETLVDEMTRNNENLVVILAGYQNEMRQLVNSNPGLTTRFKKYFHFPDYNPEELLAMTKYQSSFYQYHIEREAEAFLFTRFQEEEVKGNGRFVNNLINEAIQFQALRIEDSRESSMDLLVKSDFEQAWNTVQGEF